MSSEESGRVMDAVIPDIPAEDLELIRKLLAERTGFLLDGYKDKCIKRRINIRIRATHSDSATAYYRLLERDGRELALLHKVLTIHVSHFFRNPSMFRKLQEEILPALFTRATEAGKAGFTVWSVGCSSGEEPYSVALLLKEHFVARTEHNLVRIIASDINQEILDIARRGVYGTEKLVEVEQGLLNRYFKPIHGKYELSPEIRGMVTFSRGDLFNSRDFPACDLIFCRNVLIYFERSRQEQILEGFAASLAGRGFLVLGKSETLVGDARKKFQTVCPVERIYRALC